jgi:hypothetical protein
MRSPICLLAMLLVVVTTSSAWAGSPRQMTATTLQMNSEINAILCSVTEITVLTGALRIKCHNYPPSTFAVHNDHPFYMLPFKGQRGVRAAAIMDVLIYAREHSENIMISYSNDTEEADVGCDPDNCRSLLTVGLVKQ